MKNILQNLIFPNEHNFATSNLIVKWDVGRPKLSGGRGFPIEKGELVKFNTYYNGFSAAKWRKFTNISDIGFFLKGEGCVIVRLYQTSVNYGDILILCETVTLEEGFDQIIKELDQLETTALFVTIEAVTDASVTEASWFTPQEPIRKVALAAVITTFGREEAVKIAFKKFETEILPKIEGSHLFLIDNGQSLTLDNSNTATVIPNANLGGAGGFTRGLIEAIDQKIYTHVLFMDDDANCEPEAVQRTVAFLRHVTKDRCAVSGALLLENAPTVQHEASATFRGTGKANQLVETCGHRVDLSYWHECIHNDIREAGNYGAWWFFAFAIKDVEKLPFPFFVRGDDMEFSLQNRFEIATLNGIATHGPDFASKNSPVPEYLGERSLLVLISIHGNEKTLAAYAKRLSRKIEKLIRNWDYGKAAALIYALEDGGSGPAFFGDNPQCLFRFKDISEFTNRSSATVEELQKSQISQKSGGKERIVQKLSGSSSGTMVSDTQVLCPLSVQTRRVSGKDVSAKIKFDYDTFYSFGFDMDKESVLRKRLREVSDYWAKNSGAIFQDYQKNADSLKEQSYWRKVLGIQSWTKGLNLD